MEQDHLFEATRSGDLGSDPRHIVLGAKDGVQLIVPMGMVSREDLVAMAEADEIRISCRKVGLGETVPCRVIWMRGEK